MKKFEYGGHYHKYDMKGLINVGSGVVKVHDIIEGIPEFIKESDVIFCDPPCSKGNLKSFYTKSDMGLTYSYEHFNKKLFELIAVVSPKLVFIEVFKSNKEIVFDFISELFDNVGVYETYYYFDKSKKCWIIQGSNDSDLIDLPFLDESKIIEFICKNVDFEKIYDPCIGQGLVGFYANKFNKSFCGTELNKKRLAVLINRIEKGKL